MTLSQASRNLIVTISDNGGSLEIKGNQRSGDALLTRNLVKVKQGRYVLTVAGRKFIEKL